MYGPYASHGSQHLGSGLITHSFMLNVANQVCSKILMFKLLHAGAQSADR